MVIVTGKGTILFTMVQMLPVILFVTELVELLKRTRTIVSATFYEIVTKLASSERTFLGEYLKQKPGPENIVEF